MEEEEPEELTPEQEEQLKQLQERGEHLEEAARKIGLYHEHSHIIMTHTPFGPKPALAVHFALGEVAFATRVQDPEQAQMDHMFEAMTTELTNTDFEEERRRMKRNVEAGRDAMDDGDED